MIMADSHGFGSSPHLYRIGSTMGSHTLIQELATLGSAGSFLERGESLCLFEDKFQILALLIHVCPDGVELSTVESGANRAGSDFDSLGEFTAVRTRLDREADGGHKQADQQGRRPKLDISIGIDLYEPHRFLL